MHFIIVSLLIRALTERSHLCSNGGLKASFHFDTASAFHAQLYPGISKVDFLKRWTSRAALIFVKGG